MSLIVELCVFPMDKGASVGAYVARAVGVIRESGLPYKLTPMGTCIEGEWAEVMGVVRRCFEVLAADSDRVFLTINADWRRGRVNGLSSKTATVERVLAGGQS